MLLQVKDTVSMGIVVTIFVAFTVMVCVQNAVHGGLRADLGCCCVDDLHQLSLASCFCLADHVFPNPKNVFNGIEKGGCRRKEHQAEWAATWEQLCRGF